MNKIKSTVDSTIKSKESIGFKRAILDFANNINDDIEDNQIHHLYKDKKVRNIAKQNYDNLDK